MELSEKLTGMVNGSDGPVIFICDGFHFLFLANRPMEWFSTESTTLITDKNGYLHGITHQNRSIYIHAGRNIKFGSKLDLHTSHYYLCDSGLSEYSFEDFRGLRFVDGSLHKVFLPRATSVERTDDGLKVNVVNDLNEYKVKVCDRSSTIRIKSDIIEHHSIESGSRISNDTVKLDLIFDENAPISIIQTAYKSIVALCRLMTGRINVGFDKISLLIDVDDYDGYPYPAIECFFEANTDSPTNRSSHDCIRFPELSNREIAGIMETISSKGNRLSCVWMDFLVSDNSTLFIMTDTKIKEIISSFESAMELVEIKVVIDKGTENFKKYIKKVVKDQKRSPKRMMDESMYDNFLNYMGKWNTTNTADQITSAYARYMDVLINLSIPNEYRLSKEGVLALIRHRNDVTHGRINEMSKHKMFTALQIMATTYCCILDAAHFSQEKMSKIIQKGILNVI